MTVALLETMPLLIAAWSMIYSTVYVAVSPTAKVPSVAVFDVSKVGLNTFVLPSPFVRTSVTCILDNVTSPVFSIVIVYVMESPRFVRLSAPLSTVATLVTVIFGD